VPGENPVLCPGGVRIEEGKEYTQGTDKCGTIKHNCPGSSSTCTIRWCLTDGTTKLSFGSVAGEPECTVASVVVNAGRGSITYAFPPGTTCAEGLFRPAHKEISTSTSAA
jgi:hypothetical protein